MTDVPTTLADRLTEQQRQAPGTVGTSQVQRVLDLDQSYAHSTSHSVVQVYIADTVPVVQ